MVQLEESFLQLKFPTQRPWHLRWKRSCGCADPKESQRSRLCTSSSSWGESSKSFYAAADMTLRVTIVKNAVVLQVGCNARKVTSGDKADLPGSDEHLQIHIYCRVQCETCRPLHCRQHRRPAPHVAACVWTRSNPSCYPWHTQKHLSILHVQEILT